MKVVLIYLGSFYVLWFLYLGIMSLKRAKDAGKLGRVAYIMGYPWLILGYLVDFVVNIFASLVFLELPRETTVTARLSRLIRNDPDGWRGKFALWVCAEILDAFDPDEHHCGCEGRH